MHAVLSLFCISLYSFLLSVSLFYTSKINELNAAKLLKSPHIYIVESGDAAQIFQWFLPVLLLVGVLAFFLRRCGLRAQGFSSFSTRHIALFLFVMWFPFILAFFPCPGMNDTIFISRHLIGSSLQHPFYYCLFLYVPTHITQFLFGSMTYGLFLTTLIQMAFMACSIAFVVNWIHRRLRNVYLYCALILYFAFTPIIANYAIAAVKDTFFSVTLLLWIPFLFAVLAEGETIFGSARGKHYFLLLAFMTVATRNNGLYIFVALLLVLLYRCAGERKQLLKYSAIILLLCTLPNMYLSVFRGKDPPVQETVAVPIQQFARTVAVDGQLSRDQKAYLSHLLPLDRISRLYDPFNVDLIKWNGDFNRQYLQQTRDVFFDTWQEGLWQNGHIYLDAWVLQTFGLWGNETRDWTDQSKFGYALTDEVLQKKEVSPAINWSFQLSSIPLPEGYKETLGHYLYDHSDYINPGNCFWILLFCVVVLVVRKKARYALVFLPVFLCWGTLMVAAPYTFAYRYAFMYPLCLPFLVLLPFVEPSNGKEPSHGQDSGTHPLL